jgi:hypothetical protein
MQVTSSGPFRVASLLWTPRPGATVLTVVCKATFQLCPGESPLAAEQDLPNEDDNHWNDDPSRSVYSPCDLVPHKPRADVLLVGSAFAPGGQPVRSLLVRLAVGAVDKSIEVFLDRAFARDGKLREGSGLVKMPVRWERAAGGPDTWNPVGVRLHGLPDANGNVAIPNLQPAGLVVARPTDPIPPVGFGPIASTWPERRDKLGRLAGSWPQPGWMDQPLPDHLDRAYFNAAPRDQQLDALRGDERIVLENLHPEHPRLVTVLQAIRPEAHLARQGKPIRTLEMRADTLWIDTDRGLCTLTWRAEVPLERRDEPGTVRITVAARPGQDGDDAAQTMSPIQRQPVVMPFVAGRPEESPMARAGAAEAAGTMRLQDGELEEISVDEELPGRSQEAAVQTMFLSGPPQPAAAMPFVAAAMPAPAPQPAAPPAPGIAPPEMVAPAMAPPPMAPQRAQSIGERAAAQVMSPNMIPIGGGGPVAGGGAFEASNAAAGPALRRPEPEVAPAPAVVEPRPRATAREVIKLLWFDGKSVARIRKQADWRVILAELELRLLDEGDYGDDDAPEAGDEPKPKDRRDVFEVLVKGRPIGADGVRVALSEAIGDDGRFEPPLVLLAGELEFPFDELATLRATAAAASPFAMGDKKLKEQLDVVEELLKTPWLQGSGSIARGLTEKIEEAFTQAKRGVGAEYLSGHTERTLLEQRCYQTRTVFGKRWIRSTLGGSGVPVYVPEALKDELPMFKRVRVKLIGEVDMQEDQFEAGGAAIKVMAMGRVMG